MSDRWIWISKWETFQHYVPEPGRVPAWTKMYTQLITDEAYLDLSSHRRGVLHGLWLAFASSRCRLGADTRSLSSRLRLRVTTPDIVSLSDAGFIEVCSRETLESLYRSSMTALASRAPARSREKEKDKEDLDLGLDKSGVRRPVHVWTDADQTPDLSFITGGAK